MNAPRILAALSSMTLLAACSNEVVYLRTLDVTSKISVECRPGFTCDPQTDPKTALALQLSWYSAPETDDNGLDKVDVCLPALPDAAGKMTVSVVQPDGSERAATGQFLVAAGGTAHVYGALSYGSDPSFLVGPDGEILLPPGEGGPQGRSVVVSGRDVTVKYVSADGQWAVVEQHHVDGHPKQVHLIDGSQDLLKCNNLRLNLFGGW